MVVRHATCRCVSVAVVLGLTGGLGLGTAPVAWAFNDVNGLIDDLGYNDPRVDTSVRYHSMSVPRPGFLRLDIGGALVSGRYVDFANDDDNDEADGLGFEVGGFLPFSKLGLSSPYIDRKYPYLRALLDYDEADQSLSAQNLQPTATSLLFPGLGSTDFLVNPNGISLGITPGVTTIEQATYDAEFRTVKGGLGVGAFNEFGDNFAIRHEIDVYFGESDIDTMFWSRTVGANNLVLNNRYDADIEDTFYGVGASVTGYYRVPNLANGLARNVILFSEVGVHGLQHDVDAVQRFSLDLNGVPFERQSISLSDEEFTISARFTLGAKLQLNRWSIASEGFYQYGGYAPQIDIPGGGAPARLSGSTDERTWGVGFRAQYVFPSYHQQ